MTRAANLTRDLAQHRSATIIVVRQAIHLDLSRASNPDVNTFDSTSTITLIPQESSVEIDVVAQQAPSVEVDGRAVASSYADSRVRVDGLTPGVEHTVVVSAQCLYSHTGEGLHRYFDPEDGETYLYTHFEPTDARRVFACFDQPDMKTSFEVSVTAPAHWVVRANGAAESVTAVPELDGTARSITSFAPTQRQSTYIVCIAAGPYAVVEDEWTSASGEVIPLALLCRPAMQPHLPASDMFRWTKSGLPWCEKKFGYHYPWRKYDQIFVPEYNIGAMENPGLVTFNELYLKRGEATSSEREALSNVVLHEMAHMWFGDLVTMPWWDDLWLKESFADFIGSQAQSEVTEFTDAWLTFGLRRKAWAYTADELPSTHPIVADIPDVEAARANFDGITYAKGASVLRQLVAYVGEDAFFNGAAKYFAKHAFGNARLDDLLVELSAASGRDMSEWARAWLQTAGPDTLTLTSGASEEATTSAGVASTEAADASAGNAGASTVQLRRESRDAVTGQAANRPHRLTVTSFAVSEQGWAPTGEETVDVAADVTDLTIPSGPTLVDDGNWTYATIRPGAVTLRAFRDHLSALAEPSRRGVAWGQLWQLTRDAQLPATDFLDIVNQHLGQETSPTIVNAVVTHASTALTGYLPVADRPSAGDALWRLARQAHERALADPDARDLALAWRKALLTAAAHAPSAMDDVADVLGSDAGLIRADDDERWALLTSLMAHTHTADDLLTDQRHRDSTKRGLARAIEVEAARGGTDAKQRAWAQTDNTALTNEEVAALVAGLTHPATVADASGLQQTYFDSLLTWWETRSQVIASKLANGLFAVVSAPDAADAWLTAHPDAPGALRRIVLESVDTLRRQLRAQECVQQNASERASTA